ncbi:MAG: methionyl-tRNA formyltransferase [Verrucomicrobiota bacterium]|nr:methionyl-tRNA formyltransferase [Verrucomicrobiota bacterium]
MKQRELDTMEKSAREASILFMGTPELAAYCLRQLVLASREEGRGLWKITGVISQPDKPKGRNLRLQPTPVKLVAEEFGIECYQPRRARDPEALEWISSKAPDLIIVVAYGQILPQALLDIPRLGCVNVHTSLLPRYRGAAPIQWAICDDCPETGVTLMKMDAGLDTGDIIASVTTPICEEDDCCSLHERLAELGADLLVATLPDYLAGRITPVPQPEGEQLYARKICKEDGRRDWCQPVRSLCCRIRAMTPWPGAFTFLPVGEKKVLLKIWEATGSCETVSEPPGTILKAEGDELHIACAEGILKVHCLQREGKNRLTTRQFLSGHRDLLGVRLG